MTGPSSPRGDWDDARLTAAFRARFDAPPPTALPSRVRERLAGIQPGARASFVRPSFSVRLAAAPLVVVAVALIFVASSLIGAPTPSPTTLATTEIQPTAAPTPRPTSGVALFDPAGPPPPKAVRVPGTDEDRQVLTVAQALARPASEPADREIVVGGWYEFTPVPCAAIPNPTSELENCAVDFTWLMDDGQIVEGGTRPTGPVINIVTAATDWTPPPANATIAIVVMGHFDDRRADECPSGDRQTRCRALFVVDAPLWVDGASITVSAAPNLGFNAGPFDVAQALEWRDTRTFEAELRVAGWYNAPSRFGCASTAAQPRWLVGTCEDADRWLMADPEQLLIDDGTTETHRSPKGAAFQVAFATTPSPHGNGIPDIGVRLPMPVVFIGHFRDHRSELCQPSGDQSLEGAQTACAARFVVDKVEWANGTARESLSADWRDVESLPFPDVNVASIVQQEIPNAVVLNQTLLSGGSGLPIYEPAVAATYPDLAAEPSLWVVTVLPPYPDVCTGNVCLAIGFVITSVVLVIGPDGHVYVDPTGPKVPCWPCASGHAVGS